MTIENLNERKIFINFLLIKSLTNYIWKEKIITILIIIFEIKIVSQTFSKIKHGIHLYIL